MPDINELIRALEDIVNAEAGSYAEAMAIGRGASLLKRIRTEGAE